MELLELLSTDELVVAVVVITVAEVEEKLELVEIDVVCITPINAVIPTTATINKTIKATPTVDAAHPRMFIRMLMLAQATSSN